ncbi:MAG: ABC transporter ATP-binding protein [bacterium]|nr:ABC transporter ATP-binding protein [bacterium]
MPAIEISGLIKRYAVGDGDFTAVDGISLRVEHGDVFGFLGPNGAGKTTTMKMLVGLAQPDEGWIRILGGTPKDPGVRQKIGFMPETPAFYAHLTGREFLSFAAGLFSLPIDGMSGRIPELLGRVGLGVFADVAARKYSKGMVQRLGLAQALVNDPDILFLDEPLDGLDPLGRAEVKKLLLELKHAGKTIFFNSHILADVEEICDHLAIIDHGKIVSAGSVGEVKGTHATLEEAFVAIINDARMNAAEQKHKHQPLSIK